VDELKRMLRDKVDREAHLMAASTERSRDDPQAQSQIDQLIGMASMLAGDKKASEAHLMAASRERSLYGPQAQS
jgi:hypothetical protein